MRSPTTDPELIAADWRVRAHPRSLHRVLLGNETSLVHNHAALVRLRLFAEARTTYSRYRRPFFPFAGTPVVLVDGVPTLQGFGDARIEVDRSPHLIEVQAGGARGWWTVDSAMDPEVELHFYNDICNPLKRFRSQSEPGAAWFFGPPGPRPHPPDNLDTYKWSYHTWIAVLTLWIASAWGLSPAAPQSGWLAALYLVGIFVAALVTVIGLERFARWVKERRVGAQERTFVPLALEGGSRPTTLLGRQPDKVPQIRSGAAAVVVDLRFEQVWQRIRLSRAKSVAHVEKLDYMFPDLEYLEPGVDESHWHGLVRYGEPTGEAERPWMPDPKVLIDGESIEARWARIHVELEPGEHVLRIEVPRYSHGPRYSETADTLPVIAEIRCSLGAGKTALAEVLAEIVQDFDGRAYELEVVDLSVRVRNAMTGLDSFRRPRTRLRHEGEAFQKPHVNFSLEVK